MMKKILSTLFLLSLTACGFTPQYGSSAGTAGYAPVEGLDKVEIAMIPNEEGVYLRNLLIDNFYRGGYPGTPAYVLSVEEIVETNTNLDLTIDSESTRKQIKLRTVMRLKDKSTGQDVLKRDLRAITSYNVLGSQFTTRVSEKDAREAALEDLARQIETQITLYFKR
ncbi:MAG: hypothetical protein DI551_00010 [Micavibrio aeruginosavorus]|uniref:LPS-assembly lipoprotein LptE n=1 Tax=Micavibrio aeruginosavorus TaxID=349221 RepID=A0A2W5N6D7_9BACT|nr:MAG: hypothetical protein DI551_00010 [Micavibrio aeruginosavorus]